MVLANSNLWVKKAEIMARNMSERAGDEETPTQWNETDVAGWMFVKRLLSHVVL